MGKLKTFDFHCIPVTLLMIGLISPGNQILQKIPSCKYLNFSEVMRNYVLFLRSFLLYHSKVSFYHSEYSNHWTNFLYSSFFTFLNNL